MKKTILFVILALGLALRANATLYTSGQVTGGTGNPLGIAIPDGSTLGVSTTITTSGLDFSLASIQVTLNVGGGMNGDLYAYLSYDGTLVTLLNRVGVGTINGGTSYGSVGTGFNNVTLTSASAAPPGTQNIHWTSGTLNGGTYLADGRGIDPTSSAANFNADGTQSLDDFSGMNPNGTWTLFFADVSGGGGQSYLNGWSLDITAVPEPINVALGVFGGVFLAIGIARNLALRRANF